MWHTGMNAYTVCHLKKKFMDQQDLEPIADKLIRAREGRSNINSTSMQVAE